MAPRNFPGIAALVAACVVLTYVAHAQDVRPTPAQKDHGLDLAKNPDTGHAAAIAEGKVLFEASACSDCHGASAAGGVCPSLVNAAWIYAATTPRCST